MSNIGTLTSLIVTYTRIYQTALTEVRHLQLSWSWAHVRTKQGGMHAIYCSEAKSQTAGGQSPPRDFLPGYSVYHSLTPFQSFIDTTGPK